MEKLMTHPYIVTARVALALLTLFMVFFGWYFVVHISGFWPDDWKIATKEHFWIVPSLMMSCIWWSGALVTSYFTIFFGRPLKSFKERGLIFGLTIGFIIGMVFTTLLFILHAVLLLSQLKLGHLLVFTSFGSIFGFAVGVIVGIFGEFYQRPER